VHAVEVETGDAAELERRLSRHLEHYLGEWPPRATLSITSSPIRDDPGWDGARHPVVGIDSPHGTVISVPATVLDEARALAAREGIEGLTEHLGSVVGLAGRRLSPVVFRACARLVELADLGEWVASNDVRVPAWLSVFNGDVLVFFDETGRYGAGVGQKRHDAYGTELAVGTEPAHRGKGLARRLVATAARRVFEQGAVATYLHRSDNLASAAVADAAGFPDKGWRLLGYDE
jgi:GNAT superfamily N-acetyltransferase